MEEAERQILITSAMVQAGARIIERFGEYQEEQALAWTIYSAMELARCQMPQSEIDNQCLDYNYKAFP